MTAHVLVSCPLIQDAIHEYDERLAAHNVTYDTMDVDQHLTESELLEVIDPYDAVIAGDDEFTANVLGAATSLELVVKWGIGMDNIDERAAREAGVEVRNTPGVFADEVADVVVAYTVMLTRELHHVDSEVRRGNWYTPRGRSLAGKTFGVVGVGNIGSAVVRRVDAMEMEVLGHDVEAIDEDLKRQTGIDRVGLRELVTESDVVSLHCPLREDTRHLIGAEELAAIGPEGYLVNTARGGLVDQHQLITALEESRIAGAALDVFDVEPLPETSRLTEFDSVILGSHNAQNTVESVTEVNDLAIEALLDGLGSVES